MKIFYKFLICFFTLVCSGQNRMIDFDSIVKVSIRDFRERVGENAHIVITSEYYFNLKDYPEPRYEIISPAVSTANVTTESYCVKFLFINTYRGLDLRILYFKLLRLRKRKYKLINLGIGKEYFLDYVSEVVKDD